MRLIDADALLWDIEQYQVSNGEFQEWIEIQPVIKEKKTGKWNRITHDVFSCNNCGRTFILVQGQSFMNYCPNCGEKKEIYF